MANPLGNESVVRPSTASAMPYADYQNDKDYYHFRLACNLAAYATVLGPIYLIFRWLKYTGRLVRLEQQAHTRLDKLLSLMYVNRPTSDLPTHTSTAESTVMNHPLFRWCRPSVREYGLLVMCALALQISYLTWGIMQERIMTQPYKVSQPVIAGVNDVEQTFHDSQFLVFINRLSAFTLSGLAIIITYKTQPRHTAAVYNYGYASFSNIMSAWCQYEALKFVSFPTQTLGKACKIIPVMIMGKFVSNKSYPTHQYLTAAMISAGVAMFLLSRGEPVHSPRGFRGHGVKHPSQETSMAGLVLMAGYLTFDAFTSNWQGQLFSQHKMSSLQMMCGVNLFSVSLTAVSLLEQGTFSHSLTFLLNHDHVLMDCVLMAVCSAVGQLFIFFTINQFGAVTFTIIMTIRMALSIILSCFMYGHKIGVIGIFGFMITFMALFLRTYIDYRTRHGHKHNPTTATIRRTIVTSPEHLKSDERSLIKEEED